MHKVVVHYPRDGWILQRCGEEIVTRVPKAVDHGEGDVNYFINYPLFRKMPGRSAALFTHREPKGPYHRQFLTVARSVDHCVAMCNKTAEILRRDLKIPASRVSVIHMGVPERQKLCFGIAGRTYKTGRKGEQLVAAMVKEGLDVVAWGKGWPCPIWDGDRDSFYQQIDYLVVTAVNEGGPMPVLEALAHGVPVIAPDVGWCWEYSVIRYSRGNWQSLSETIRGLQPRLWQDWAEDHGRLFARLLGAGIS